MKEIIDKLNAYIVEEMGFADKFKNVTTNYIMWNLLFQSQGFFYNRDSDKRVFKLIKDLDLSNEEMAKILEHEADIDYDEIKEIFSMTREELIIKDIIE